MKKLPLLFFVILLLSCKNESSQNELAENAGNFDKIQYANGFKIQDFNGYKILTVTSPWPDAEKSLKYVLVKDKKVNLKGIYYDEKIEIPVKKIVVTSTTHIPFLELLDETNSLIGFPGLDYISSEEIRKKIISGNITELGKNEDINTEILINLQPEVVIGFAINSNNKTYQTIKKVGIPVLYNGDWTEQTPLGKAEWIKFFGALFDKSQEAETIFTKIETDYLEAKKLAQKSNSTPSVLSGSMFKDQWYVPFGNSWQAQFIKDANASYIYSNLKGNGSKSLSFETVLSDGNNADFWIAPGQFTSYNQLLQTSQHYSQFKAVQNRNVFTYSNTTGETGGVIYYELAPARPDLVLKDLIKIFHPELLKDYKPVFFKPLN